MLNSRFTLGRRIVAKVGLLLHKLHIVHRTAKGFQGLGLGELGLALVRLGGNRVLVVGHEARLDTLARLHDAAKAAVASAKGRKRLGLGNLAARLAPAVRVELGRVERLLLVREEARLDALARAHDAAEAAIAAAKGRQGLLLGNLAACLASAVRVELGAVHLGRLGRLCRGRFAPRQRRRRAGAALVPPDVDTRLDLCLGHGIALALALLLLGLVAARPRQHAAVVLGPRRHALRRHAVALAHHARPALGKRGLLRLLGHRSSNNKLLLLLLLLSLVPRLGLVRLGRLLLGGVDLLGAAKTTPRRLLL